MSSYSGEVGLIYRSAYCASKFAVNGFFEALRMEVGDDIAITIVCPITIENTNFKNNYLKIGNHKHFNIQNRGTRLKD